jgi:hypothetical protein
MARAWKFLFLALAVSSAAYAKRPPPEPVKLYDGETLPIEQVASIGTDININKFGAGILAIDGAMIDMSENKGVHILPGEHEFTFWTAHKPTAYVMETTRQTLKMRVEAGHTYIPVLSKDEATKRITFDLRDAGTGYDQGCLVGSYPDKSKTRENAVGCLVADGPR